MTVAACGSSSGNGSRPAAVGASVQAGGSVNASKMPEGSTAFRIGLAPWAGTQSNNPYNPSFNAAVFDDLALMGLAYYSNAPRPGRNPYYPELASRWELAKSSITIHLRPSAKWQDGRPFTSADVLTSLLLAGADGSALWGAVTSVSTPNAHEVKLDLQPWAVAKNVFVDLLQVTMLPKSEYASLVPKGLQQDLISYWKTYNVLHPSTASIAAAASSSAGKLMSATVAKLVKFNPPKFIGDGPYQLVKDTVGGQLYKKWNGWWDAKAIRAPWVQIYPMSSATEYGAQISGRIEYQRDSQYTDPQVEALNRSGTSHYVPYHVPDQQEAFLFHLADYPFNLLPVRKALAYLINRTKLAALDNGGTLMQNPPTAHPDGINDFEADRYLSKKQLDSLQAYNYDPKEATALLKSVGFTKRHGTWYTAKGKPFAFTIDEPAGAANLDLDGLSSAKMLASFGIKATSTDVNASSYFSEMISGDFAVSEWYMDVGLANPISWFSGTFGGSAWNYPLGYNGQGSCNCKIAIGIGPEADVPGLGRVNVAAALQEEVNSAPPSTWPKYTWDWARWINQQLPILSLTNNAYHGSYTATRYTDFPPRARKWLYTPIGGAEGMVVWQQLGYLRLKKP